jgi:S1-C subfamily serine protease
MPRGAALLGGMAAVLVGCGGQTKTVTVTRPAPPLTAAPSAITTTATPVPKSIAASAEKSVLAVNCFVPTTGSSYFEGTGFKVASGVVTASHVVAACPTPTIVFGGASGYLKVVDSRHDAALVTYVDSPGSSPQPLRAESARPYVGEPLALIGIPAVSQNPLSPLVSEEATVITPGIVLATHQTQQLDAGRETLTDAIRVAASGVVPGESGGPAIDAAGKVVGVIEGSGVGVATLTPVAHLTSLH